MKRRIIIIAVVIVVIAVLAFAFPRRSDEIATFRVQPSKFSRRVTAEGNLKAVNATPLAAPHDAPGPLKVAWIADEGTLLHKGDVIVRFDPTDFENLLLDGNEAHSTAANKLTKATTDAGTTRTNLKRDARQAQSELESARKFKFDDAEIFSRYQRIESEVDESLAGDKKQHAENVLGVRESLANAEHDLLSIEDRKAGLKIRNAQQGLKSLELITPYDGILVLQRDWRGEVPRVGTTAWPGMPLGEIPDLAAMKAEVFVLEADAAGLAVDKKATVALESAPGVTYSGKVTQVDKLARPRVRNVPVQYFGVTISLDKTDPKLMKPGTRVRAVLDVEDRNDAFAIPRQALFEKEGKKLVYRRRGDKFEPVAVEIASATAGRVVVTKGIVKGDEIALVDPSLNDERGRMNDEHGGSR
ncbi:MAG TPA: HlyD family efflux transporter periplasmic adaptor subunit [Thermoanaerobaculia bacterium]|nr:HlyD family efflux transporter periplasmic adaptor subunit [Thermoanaerobaculia bacterium]